MAKCGTCNKNVGSSQPNVTCNDCQKVFHGACQRMSKADIECLASDDLVWRCGPCGADRRKSMRLESDTGEGKLTLEDIMTAITEMKADQKTMEQGFNASYEAMQSKLEENIKVVQDQNVKNEQLITLIRELSGENKFLRNKVTDLENRLEEMEQYSRSNVVEIHGIPQEKNEDVVNVVKEVGKALDMPITDAMIDTCHRLGKRENAPNRVPGIIVKFVRRLDKDEMLRKRRIKHNFSTRHMGLPVDQPIFINEALSPARRRLFAMAKNAKKEKGYKYLWVRRGKIFLRKEDNSAVKTVTCQADLNLL